jgi:hypothetical protein
MRETSATVRLSTREAAAPFRLSTREAVAKDTLSKREASFTVRLSTRERLQLGFQREKLLPELGFHEKDCGNS